MNCANCQTVNPDTAKFCMNCGTALPVICSNCGTLLPTGAKFCFSCGQQTSTAPAPKTTADFAETNLKQVIPGQLRAKLDIARANRTMEGERRVVTMLFCDVKGSTAMAETLDPEEWTGIMNQVFERMIAAVYKYEGTVARLMGDAILAFFGAPIAHEDDPQRAVLAGFAIIDTIRPFREGLQRTRGLDFDVRVGINTGLVVVGEVGSDLRVEYTAMGDAVNLAARMEQTAQPGTMQIAENTYKLVRHFFEFESLGGIEVKVKKDPVPSYRALAPMVRPGQPRGIEGLSSPLVGREYELKTLEAALIDLTEGKGQGVSVIGEAGLGKSRLISELRRAIPERVVWFEGRSLSYQTSTPFALFISLFNSIFELDGENSDKYGWLKTQVSRFAPGQADKLAPFIGTLLGVTPIGEDLERVKYLEPPQLRLGLFNAILALIASMAAQAPLVLVFDDLHWSDPTSLDLLKQVVDLTSRSQLLVIALFRPNFDDPSWHLHEALAAEHPQRYKSISLEPLDESHARTLVANLLEIEDLPEKVRSLILRKSEGNPFFVEEVIRSLLDAKMVVREGEKWRATREIETIAVPDTLAGVITARFDQLNYDAKRIAQTAAVIGREFGFNTIENVYESPSSLDGALTTLQQRELIREKERLPQLLFFFKHVLTQETVYATLLLSRRRDLHYRVAKYFEQTEPHRTGEIGWHFLEAQEPGRALPYLVAAGDQASRAYAAAEAMSFYQRALDILKAEINLPMARRVYEGIGRLRFLAQDMAGTIAIYQEMLAQGESHAALGMQVSALNKMSLILGYMGDIEQVDRNLSRSQELAQQANDMSGLTEMYVVRCQTALSNSDFHQRSNILANQ